MVGELNGSKQHIGLPSMSVINEERSDVHLGGGEVIASMYNKL